MTETKGIKDYALELCTKREYTGAEKAVLAWAALHTDPNDDGWAMWVTGKQAREMLGYTRQALHLAKKALVEKGIVEVSAIAPLRIRVKMPEGNTGEKSESEVNDGS